MNRLQDGFYAIQDPRDPAKVTCWRKRILPQGGQSFGPWPTGTFGTVNIRAEGSTVYRQYLDQVSDAIEVNPELAQARFAGFASRCFLCGRTLRSARWKCYGVGPECGHNFTPAELEILAGAMAEALGATS